MAWLKGAKKETLRSENASKQSEEGDKEAVHVQVHYERRGSNQITGIMAYERRPKQTQPMGTCGYW